MTSRNPTNPDVGPSFVDSWLATNMTADRLAVVQLEYHVYTHAMCRLSLEKVLRTEKMGVSLVNLKE